MTLYVARHADAGTRSDWTDDDRLRPLSARGEAQARGIAALLVDRSPARILSSPAQRCVQTVLPLAEKLDLDVTVDDRLFEGIGADEVRSLVADLDAAPTVCCTHGDVVPMLLQHLVRLGMVPERELVWEKASVWEIERAHGQWGAGRYLPPPGR